MNICAFEGVHYRTVRVDSIGFPDMFYRVVRDTGAAILTQEGEGLFGYHPDVWKLLGNSLGSLYASLEEASALIKDFLENAITCRVHIDPYLINEAGEAATAVDLIEAYRLDIPRGMIIQARLEQQAILVGMGYHFEIWSPLNWLKIKYRLRYRPITRKKTFPDIIA